MKMDVATATRRLEAQAERARVNAEYEADQCVRLAKDINLTMDPGVSLAGAERLAATATALVRYLSALEAYEMALSLLEGV